MSDSALTVGISTRNRPAALARNVEALRRLGSLVSEILIFDDASDEPVTADALPPGPQPLRVLRPPGRPGQVYGRTHLVEEAATDAILLLDDDAVVFDDAPVRRALALLDADPAVAIVAFAQAEADGSAWPIEMQPSRSTVPCQVPAHIGFAHLVRRRAFLDVGGYRAAFFFYGEEKELALRLLDAGFRVVYLPDARIAHVPDPGGRSGSRVLRCTVRNNCLGSLYNDPFPLPLVVVPLRMLQYFRMRRGWAVHDPGGLRWVAAELLRLLPDIWRQRRPVRWRTLRRWRELRRSQPPYPAP